MSVFRCDMWEHPATYIKAAMINGLRELFTSEFMSNRISWPWGDDLSCSNVYDTSGIARVK